MKDINLISLVVSYQNLRAESYKNYLKMYGIKIKNSEVEDLNKLLKTFPEESRKVALVENYFVGYEIPQIGKEFDLLRFGEYSGVMGAINSG